MARKDLQPLHDPYDQNHQAQGRNETYSATYGNSEHDDLLDFYFGEPTSTHKNSYHLRNLQSRW